MVKDDSDAAALSIIDVHRPSHYASFSTLCQTASAFGVDTWAVLWFNIRIIDLAASYAYADSIYDLPLLEAVGHPVAVSPEERLASIARQRGWPILGQVREKP